MISCEHCEELMNARLDGELTPEDARLLDDHLAQCPACRKLNQDLTFLQEGLKSLAQDPPADLTAAVMAQLESETIQTTPRKKRPWLAGICAAAVVLLSVALSPQILPFGGSDAAETEAAEAPTAADVAGDTAPAEGGEAAAAPEESWAETESQSQNTRSLTQTQALELLNNYLEERGLSLALTPGTPPEADGFWVFLGETPDTGEVFRFSVSCTNGSVSETPLP
jgi:anti-sigma factor RsiW